MNKFKLGDWVKVTDSNGCGSARIGDIGIVIELWRTEYYGIKIRTEDGIEYSMYERRFIKINLGELKDPLKKWEYLKKIKQYGIVKFLEKINV